MRSAHEISLAIDLNSRSLRTYGALLSGQLAAGPAARRALIPPLLPRRRRKVPPRRQARSRSSPAKCITRASPAPTGAHRLRMAKAMGLNTVTTYVFWNVHEPRPGVYDFSGQHDVAEFVREAQQEGLYVNLRPGPYSCAEWECGGFPAWLLKDHSIVVRSTDPKFMDPARRWLLRLGQELAPLQIGNGGPIIAVQVENEYGSFGNDHAYMEQIHRDLVDAGFGNSVLYTADSAREHSQRRPARPARRHQLRPRRCPAIVRHSPPTAPQRPLHGRRMLGWLVRSLGRQAPRHRRQATSQRTRMDPPSGLFDQHLHVSRRHQLRLDERRQHEQDAVRARRHQLRLRRGPRRKRPPHRQVLSLPRRHRQSDRHHAAAGSCRRSVRSAVPACTLTRLRIALATPFPHPSTPNNRSPWKTSTRPTATSSIAPPSPVPSRAISSSTTSTTTQSSTPTASSIGTLDRRLDQNTLHVDLTTTAHTPRHPCRKHRPRQLHHRPFAASARASRTRSRSPASRSPAGKSIRFPCSTPASFPSPHSACTGACFYRGTLQVDHPGDTFLDTSRLHQRDLSGSTAIRLGRIWNIGPQKTLYLPGPWLHSGANDVIVFDLDGAPGRTISGDEKPNLGPPLLRHQ